MRKTCLICYFSVDGRPGNAIYAVRSNVYVAFVAVIDSLSESVVHAYHQTIGIEQYTVNERYAACVVLYVVERGLFDAFAFGKTPPYAVFAVEPLADAWHAAQQRRH